MHFKRIVLALITTALFACAAHATHTNAEPIVIRNWRFGGTAPAQIGNAATNDLGRVKADTAPADAASPSAAEDNSPAVTGEYLVGAYPSLPASLSAIGSAEATLVVGSSVSAAGVTVPANVHLRFTGSGQFTGSGSVKILGSLTAPLKRIFASTLTVSFAGNRRAGTLNACWWGVKADNSTDDSAAYQAFLDAACTNTASRITTPVGTSRIGSALVLNRTGDYKSIVWDGPGVLGTKLLWVGSPSGTMLTVQNLAYFEITHVQFANGTGSRSSTRGLLLAGPGNGTQVHAGVLKDIAVIGFSKGMDVGEPSTVHAASELTYINVEFQNCDVGWQNNGPNSTDNIFYMLFLNSNAVGLYTRIGTVHVFGGANSHNTRYDFRIEGPGTTSIRGVRSESQNRFIYLSSAAPAYVVVDNCLTEAPTSADKVVIEAGLLTTNLTLLGNKFSGKVSVTAGSNKGSLTMIGNGVQDKVLANFSGADGIIGRSENNHSVSAAGTNVVDLFFQNGDFAVASNAIRYSRREGVATLAAGTVTVADAQVTANTRIFVNRQTDRGTVGASYSVRRVAGVSFTITSKDGSGATQALDTSTVSYSIIEP